MNITDLAYVKANNYFRAVVLEGGEHGYEGARFQVVKVPSGETVQTHFHRKRIEVFTLLGGSGEIYINDDIVASKLNDIATCHPNDTHKVINTGTDNLYIGVNALNYFIDDIYVVEEL